MNICEFVEKIQIPLQLCLTRHPVFHIIFALGGRVAFHPSLAGSLVRGAPLTEKSYPL